MATRINSGAGKRKRRSNAVERLSKLEPGDKTVISYRGRTPFSAWIAVQRKRLNLPFGWMQLSPSQFEISLSGEKPEPVVEEDPLDEMDWYADPLPNKPLVVKVLNLFRFAPRHGKGGGLVKVAQSGSGVSMYKARLWAKHLGGTKILQSADPAFRRFLAEFVRAIRLSDEVKLVYEIYERAKKGKAVEVRLTRSQLGVVLNALRKTSYAPTSKRLDTRKPSLYSITLRHNG